MTTRRKIILAVSCALISVVAIVQVTTYCLWADAAMPITGLKTLGFSEGGTERTYVVLQDGVWQSLSEEQRTSLRAYLSDATENIYLTHKDLPDGSIRTQGELFEYVGGTSLNWKLVASGPFWMTCQCGYGISSTGAEGREDVYVWFLWGWVRLYNKYRYAA
ncbi:MAG: hypothetical protein ACYS9X_11005 [Planctomycetota bacterium]